MFEKHMGYTVIFHFAGVWGAIIVQHLFCTLQFQKCCPSLVAIVGAFFSNFSIANTTGVMMKIANPNHASKSRPKLPSILPCFIPPKQNVQEQFN